MVHYPNGRKHAPVVEKNQKKQVEFGKRGMSFEESINESNAYYLTRGMAVLHKKPTPIQIVKVDYPHRSRAKITEAYFRHASTTDYNGVYKGLYLDFEAKETKNKSSFPFSNFHIHQIQHMEQVIKQNGIAFVLLYFSTLNRIFYLPSLPLIQAFYEKERKSIPLSFVEENGFEIQEGIAPRIPFLQIIDRLIEEKEHGN
ncbi:MAG: Holliday junction resolvase RecU [Streptococcaceae bacterium]|nr:Holliday junction resolvase RecU [Streptococcaceae bacterium]